MSPAIRAPIFIVGPLRSGTTVLYEKLARHPDLAWISRVTKKAPGSLLLTRALMWFRNDHSPTEAKNVWSRFSRGSGMTRRREDVTPLNRWFLRRVVRHNLEVFGKPRFLSKDPGNSLRVAYLDEIFPDAIFVHIIRDGRAVAESVVRHRVKQGGGFYGLRIPGWEQLTDRPMLEVAGLQWRAAIESVRRDAASLPPERYFEVRYEDFAATPADVLEAIARRCRLEAWDPALLKDLVSGVESRDFKWQTKLSADDLEQLNRVIGDLLEELGYE